MENSHKSNETGTCNQPLVSVLVPTMNEEISVGPFISMCFQGFRNAGVDGEIILVDSSTDRTPEIAQSMGARVITCHEKGIGRAYQIGVDHVRGKYVIMGDADCTYDFAHISPFIEALNQGYEYVMGSRTIGTVEKGSRPPLHRFFGAPLTNFIFNKVIGSSFSDIHCGMRAMTLEALKRIHLTANGWEYASEMIIRSIQLKLKTTEVPINFLKEPEGRQGKLVANRLEPWRAGWRTLHTVFVNRPEFFLMKPGMFGAVIGYAFSLLILCGMRSIGDFNISVYTSTLLSLFILICGSAFFFGILARELRLRKIPDLIVKNRNLRFDIQFRLLLVTSVVTTVFLTVFIGRFVNNDFTYNSSLSGIARLAVFSFTTNGIVFLSFVTGLILEMVSRTSGREMAQ